MKKNILLAVAVLATISMKAGDLTGLRIFDDSPTSNFSTTSYHPHGGGGGGGFSFGISLGAALPQSAWGAKAQEPSSNGSTSSNNVISDGFASVGLHLDATATYIFAGPVGATVMIGGNMNSFDAAKYQSVNNYPSFQTLTATNYYSGQFLVGPCLAFGSDFKVTVRGLVGMVMIGQPTYTTTSTIGSATETSVTTGKAGNGFGYGGGLGIKYNFNSSMGLLVNVDYLAANITYPDGSTTKTTVGSNSTTSSPTTYTQTMAFGLITASVGIAFNL